MMFFFAISCSAMHCQTEYPASCAFGFSGCSSLIPQEATKTSFSVCTSLLVTSLNSIENTSLSLFNIRYIEGNVSYIYYSFSFEQQKKRTTFFALVILFFPSSFIFKILNYSLLIRNQTNLISIYHLHYNVLVHP